MFSAVSMAPAPSPRGTAHRHIAGRFSEKENPSSAAAVMAVLTAATLLVPSSRMIFALITLDTIVPQQMVTLTKLAKEMGS